MDNNEKRKFREMPDETKRKISDSLRGRPKSSDHASRISQGLKSYWEQVPTKQEYENPEPK